jgi:aminodeoxyfutalosine deaminase
MKLKADKIFDGQQFLASDTVLVTNAQGKIEAILPAKEAGDDVQYLNGILCPGFINCHCHLELSHMDGLIPEKTGMVDFLLTVLQQRSADEASMMAAMAQAEQQMMNNGIVAVGDISNTTNSIAIKQQQNLRYHHFVEITGFAPTVVEQRWQNANAVAKEFAAAFGVNQVSLVPHAPYSVANSLFARLNKAGSLQTMHNQESAAENDFFLGGESDFYRLYETIGIDVNNFFTPTKKSSWQTVLPHFSEVAQTIWVHNNFISENDLLLAKAHINQHFFCLCPNANLYIQGILPPLDLLLANDVNIVLGTDSLASNHQLSILAEMKTLQQYFPHVELTQLLRFATANGARALQLQNDLGSIAIGKQPGLVLMDEALTKAEVIV